MLIIVVKLLQILPQVIAANQKLKIYGDSENISIEWPRSLGVHSVELEYFIVWTVELTELARSV